MPRQIGWSQESNLLYDILMQLDRLLTVAGGGGGLEVYPTFAAFPPVGDEGIIYLAQDTNKLYYWDIGTLSYVEISPGLTSVGLTMPSAFTVTNSPLVSNGTIAVTGAGLVSQYVRGDGSLADFPGSTGGGASVSYYINGGTNQGVFGGNTYYEMSRVADTGASVNFSTAVDGYVAQFITDAGDPSLLQIPGGAWNIQFYLNASSAGGTPSFYVELYKYDGAVFTLLGSSSANPEQITGGTSVDLYYTSVSVPTTTLLITDRLAIRVYVVASGRTITLYTQNGTLGEIITTFTSGMTALNGLTAQVQFLTTGTAGTDFTISSSGVTHTFDLPVASAVNTGKLSASDWNTFNTKAVEILGAGTNSTIRCGVNNSASAACSAALGGACNTAGWAYASSVGGFKNLSSGAASFVGGGVCNNVCNSTSGCLSTGAVVAGGVGNNTTGGTWDLPSCSFTAAPTICNAGYYSFVGSGLQNRATCTGTIVVGGGNNTASGLCSVVVGGNGNTASCSSSFIGAGRLNTASGTYSGIVSAQSSTASGASSFIGGGSNNVASGVCSFIGGGIFNCAFTCFSVIVGGYNGRSCGTANFLGAGCDNVASSILSFLGGGFCNKTEALWTGLVGGCRNCSSGIAGFVGGGICNNICNNSHTCLALGAVVVGGVGNNTTGGTWDLATCSFTVAPTICNAGQYSFIGGGFQNKTTANYSTIVGGFNNNSLGLASTLVGGCNNSSCGGVSFVGGGSFNFAFSNCSVVVGGSGNGACAFAFVGGGEVNISSGTYSSIVSGSKNLSQAVAGFIGNGICNNVCNNTSGCLAIGATVVGGVGNNTTGGTWAIATCNFTVAPTICNAGCMSFVGGGFQNAATGCFSAVLGGQCNIASGAYSGAFGCNLTASAACTFYTNNHCICGCACVTVATAGATALSVTGTTGTLLTATDSSTGNRLQVNNSSGTNIFAINNNGAYYPSSATCTGFSTTPNTIFSFDKTTGSSAFFDYYVRNTGTNGWRAGTVMAVWDGTNVCYTDTATNDLNASTAALAWSVDISGSNVRLRATLASGTWDTKVGARVI